MRSFNFCLTVTRPKLIVLSALSTWVIAMLSNGPHLFTTTKIMAPIAISLSVLGASVYHFGVANPMHTRKEESLEISLWARIVMGLIGFIIMLWALDIASKYLNTSCLIVVAFDAIVLTFYPNYLSRYWVSKNFLMALVCVSPILLGWFAGDRMNSAVPYGISVTFFIYLCREIVKDIQDRNVNNGYRHTLPLTLGVERARRIASGAMMAGLFVLTIFGFYLIKNSWYAFIPYYMIWRYLAKVAYALARHRCGNEKAEIKQIFVGSCWLMLTFFLLIF